MTELALFELLTLESRVDADGSVRYYNAQGQIHRVHGPAIEHADGSRDWFHTGQRRRLGTQQPSARMAIVLGFKMGVYTGWMGQQLNTLTAGVSGIEMGNGTG